MRGKATHSVFAVGAKRCDKLALVLKHQLYISSPQLSVQARADMTVTEQVAERGDFIWSYFVTTRITDSCDLLRRVRSDFFRRAVTLLAFPVEPSSEKKGRICSLTNPKVHSLCDHSCAFLCTSPSKCLISVLAFLFPHHGCILRLNFRRQQNTVKGGGGTNKKQNKNKWHYYRL